MREQLQEILATISRNKLRTCLTGFSVAWGIFMLIILLGSGNGLQNGVMSNFEGMALNSGSMWSGYTSMPYGGYQKDRRIRMEKSDIDLLRRKNSNITDISGRVSVYDKQISMGKEYAKTHLYGIEPIYAKTEGIKCVEGRLLNQRDVKDVRKVVVIAESMAKALSPRRSAVGQNATIDGTVYRVIGTYKARYQGNNPESFIPLTTMQRLYSRNKYLNEIMFTVDGIETQQQNEEFEKEVVKTLASAHNFDKNDRRAVRIWSAAREYLQTMMIFNGVKMFVWIIGLGTLMAGIVGVSNIMLVTVRERTAEFGIRKSMGATPASLVKLILVESVLITAVFGYLGLILGVGVMEVVNILLERQMEAATKESMVIFLNPTLNLSVVFSATFVLVIAGMIAGYIPARRAAQIKTIDAMRFNK